MNQTMNTVMAGLFLLCSMSTASAQSGFNTQASDSTNMYQFALTQYVKALKKSKRSSSTLYVLEDLSVTAGLPKTRRHYNIEYLNKRAIKRLLKRDKGQITLLRIRPVAIRGSVFWVKVQTFNTYLDKDKLAMTETESTAFSFRFNCDTKVVEFADVLREVN